MPEQRKDTSTPSDGKKDIVRPSTEKRGRPSDHDFAANPKFFPIPPDSQNSRHEEFEQTKINKKDDTPEILVKAVEKFLQQRKDDIARLAQEQHTSYDLTFEGLKNQILNKINRLYPGSGKTSLETEASRADKTPIGIESNSPDLGFQFDHESQTLRLRYPGPPPG